MRNQEPTKDSAMPIKTMLFVFIAFTIGYATSPSNASDAISCDSFEGCPDGSTDVTNQLLQMQAEIEALQVLVATMQSELEANSAADTLAHHNKYTGAEAIAAVGPHYTNANAIAAVGPHFGGDHADLTNVLATQHHTKYTDAESIAAVGPHSPDFSTLLAGVSRGVDPNTSQDTLTFTNMNVQLVSGSGETFGAITGTGNLIIGYNETRNETFASVPCPSDVETEFACNRRTGSHMLIIGEENNYTSFGGMVVGANNETSARSASVSGGSGNIATSWYSSVSGGRGNTASSDYASVSGGNSNTASANYASVSGGSSNTASGFAASVSGGNGKTAGTTSCWTADGVDNC